ncbi:hypothetical protein MMC12_005170 [Toensbergia leucococca]|nr:hypothetical protein [Toensbergia leucococca]
MAGPGAFGPTTAPQAYQIQCKRNARPFPPDPAYTTEQHKYIFDSCLPHEICVQAWTYSAMFLFRQTPLYSAARCISTDNYRKIADTLLGKMSGRVQIPENPSSSGQQVLADAIMTGPTLNTSAQAQSMTMSALRQLSSINYIPQSGQIPGQVWNCQDCFNIGPIQLPMAMNALAASATLAAGTAGTLFLTTFLPGQ